MRRNLHLYKEAFAVGAAFVPLLYLVSRTTAALKLSAGVKPYIDGAIAGFLFHITAEETGVNAWFLTESYAANKVLWNNKHVSAEHDALGRIHYPGLMALPPQIYCLFQHSGN